MFSKPSSLTFRTLGAWATAGVALWCSLGVLDITDGPTSTMRLAMLPDLVQLAGSLTLALLLGVVLHLGAVHKTSSSSGDAVLPLYGLGVLVLPYLPWLPDALPVLRVFAGPGRYLVWGIVLSQMIWAALGSGGGRQVVAALHALPARRAFLLVFAASALVSVGASRALAPSGIFPAGDEAHYLVVTQSLIADRDLDLANNYRQRSYASYYGGDLEARTASSANALTGRTALPVGVPLLLMPAFAAAGYPGAVLFLNLLAAIAASATWLWVRRVTGSVSSATFAWASTALSVPVLASGGAIAPDVPASVLVVLAGSWALWTAPLEGGNDGDSPHAIRGWRLVALGVSVGTLPWLHLAYLIAAVVLLAVGVWRVVGVKDDGARRGWAGSLALLASPLVASGSLWMWCYSGVPLSARLWQTPPGVAGLPSVNLIGRHLLALIADQAYGALAYAPVLAVAAMGLWALWRRGSSARGVAVEIALVVTALAGSAAVFRAQQGGALHTGDFVLPAFLLLAVPLAYEYRRSGQRPERRAVYRLFLLMGLGASIATFAVRGGTLLALGRNGMSPLIAWLSPDWPLTSFAPDFLAQSAWTGLAQAAVWLAAVVACTALVTWLADRTETQSSTSRIGRGLAFWRANAGAMLALMLATAVMPLLLGAAIRSGPEPRDRQRIEMLATFDPYTRPTAIRFDPWSLIDARDLPQLFELSARPIAQVADHPGETPFNARFALPAGRYRIQIIARPSTTNEGPLSGKLVLQAGTWGGSMIEWAIEGTGTRQWKDTFDLPADLGLVTFATSGRLGQQVRELRITPFRVVPFLDRIAADDVRAAAPYDRLLCLFHDENAYPDEKGFWVRGTSRARVSVVARSGRLVTDLRLFVGSHVANSILIEMPDRIWTEELGADEEREIVVKPTMLDGTIRLVMTTKGGWYPIDTEPGSKDRRHLGCYVRILE